MNNPPERKWVSEWKEIYRLEGPAEKQSEQCSNGRSNASMLSLNRGIGADETKMKNGSWTK
jgi:hypothetical protein